MWSMSVEYFKIFNYKWCGANLINWIDVVKIWNQKFCEKLEKCDWNLKSKSSEELKRSKWKSKMKLEWKAPTKLLEFEDYNQKKSPNEVM